MGVGCEWCVRGSQQELVEGLEDVDRRLMNGAHLPSIHRCHLKAPKLYSQSGIKGIKGRA